MPAGLGLTVDPPFLSPQGMGGVFLLLAAAIWTAGAAAAWIAYAWRRGRGRRPTAAIALTVLAATFAGGHLATHLVPVPTWVTSIAASTDGPPPEGDVVELDEARVRAESPVAAAFLDEAVASGRAARVGAEREAIETYLASSAGTAFGAFRWEGRLVSVFGSWVEA